uniref:ATP synthase complex subunit 8 n=1 Tax=Platorchestia parapacifica TaxID=1395100 RepID=A0A343SA05_9CRUS|nr:ATP synthase F0 subunit 8 [Platorchestia parapacifica]
MPQMAPIMWSHLFIIFNATTFILMTKIFFQNTSPNLSSDSTSTFFTNKKTWKL